MTEQKEKEGFLASLNPTKLVSKTLGAFNKLFKNAVPGLENHPELLSLMVTGFLIFMSGLIMVFVFMWKEKDVAVYIVLSLMTVFCIGIFGIVFLRMKQRAKQLSDETEDQRLKNEAKAINLKHPHDGIGLFKGKVIYHENRPERNRLFGELRNQAKYSVFIMGLGMTNIVPGDLKAKYLEKGIDVRLLMINPNVLLEHFSFYGTAKNDDNSDPYNLYDLLMKKNHINEYCKRNRYINLVQDSFENFKEFVIDTESELEEKRNSGLYTTGTFGTLQMRVFNTFVPMSFTVVNEKAREGQECIQEFIAEFLLPFKDERILVTFSKEEDVEIYKSFVESMENLWEKSDDIRTVNIYEKASN